MTISQGVVSLLCSWLVNASDLPPISYHRCLVNRVLSMLGGVAKLPRYCREVSNFLSLDNLNTHLLSSNEVLEKFQSFRYARPPNYVCLWPKIFNGCQFYYIFLFLWLAIFQFAHPVLRLLVVLSVLPEFASKFYSSVLLKTIFKLTVTSAITVSSQPVLL